MELVGSLGLFGLFWIWSEVGSSSGLVVVGIFGLGLFCVLCFGFDCFGFWWVLIVCLFCCFVGGLGLLLIWVCYYV